MYLIIVCKSQYLLVYVSQNLKIFLNKFQIYQLYKFNICFIFQTSDFVDKVIDYHKKNKGLTPGHCDKRFLDVAYRLPLYGIDLHTVMVCTYTKIHT